MPYKYETDRLKLPSNLDRRKKLTDKMRLAIKLMHKQGMSQNKIAMAMGIDRKAVRYTIDPGYYQQMLAKAKERRADGRYKPKDKKAWAATIREHRAYKQSVKEQLIK